MTLSTWRSDKILFDIQASLQYEFSCLSWKLRVWERLKLYFLSSMESHVSFQIKRFRDIISDFTGIDGRLYLTSINSTMKILVWKNKQYGSFPYLQNRLAWICSLAKLQLRWLSLGSIPTWFFTWGSWEMFFNKLDANGLYKRVSFSWCFRLEWSENAFWHTWQRNCFSPLWISACHLKLSEAVKRFAHTRHWKGLSTVWIIAFQVWKNVFFYTFGVGRVSLPYEF